MKNKPTSNALELVLVIDRVIHEPARMLIMAILITVESADFLFLTRQTGLTRGNLSSHMSKLEAAGYILVSKEFVDRIPRTLLSMTDSGREAFRSYREAMFRIINNCPSR